MGTGCLYPCKYAGVSLPDHGARNMGGHLHRSRALRQERFSRSLAKCASRSVRSSVLALLAPPLGAFACSIFTRARNSGMKLDVLPPQQRRFWPVFSELPDHFVLYVETAIGLRLGGRQSVDFDFFTNQLISADALSGSLPFPRGAELIQSHPNTSTFTVHPGREIKISFFGGLTIGRVARSRPLRR